jgi:uncharacterized protein with HEPN domain
MSKRNWKLFVEDILESIGLIESYISNMNFDDFQKDRRTIDAVVRNLEIIGEASRSIPEEIKNNHPEIDWKGIIGLRNRIAHEYFGISVSIVWEIIKSDLPALKEKIKHLLKEEI